VTATRNFFSALIAFCAIPAMAQTTTVQQQPQQGSTTTVQTQPGSTTVQTTPQPPPPPSSSTEVVVNPPPAPPPSSSARVSTYEPTTVVDTAPRRSTMAIVATDTLYGGIAGALVGGGIALINNGNNWARDLMIGTGAGILTGVAVGAVHAVIENNDDHRAVADQMGPNGARSPGGYAVSYGGRF